MTSTWHARPSDAKWYAEVIFGDDSHTDYNYGYSSAEEEPDKDTLWDMIPEGQTLIESKIIAIER